MRNPVRFVCLLLAGALWLAACDGADAVYEVPPGEAQGALAELKLPEPVPAVPAFTVKRAINPAVLQQLTEIDGMRIVATAVTRKVKVRGKTLTVAAVDPIEYRSVAPPATRDAEFVWVSLLGGEAVVTAEAAAELNLAKKGADLPVGGGTKLRIGSVAENGAPNFADAIVDVQHVNWGEPDVAILGIGSGITLEVLGRDLREMFAGATVQRIRLSTQRYDAPAPISVQTATIAVPASSITGLHPALEEAVGRLLSASGGRVYLVSGFRDHQRQYELWVQALQRYGDPEIADNWVAPPGSSYHERGLAVDLGGDLALAARLVQQLGLPLWRPMSWEPWHFELSGSRG